MGSACSASSWTVCVTSAFRLSISLGCETEVKLHISQPVHASPHDRPWDQTLGCMLAVGCYSASPHKNGSDSTTVSRLWPQNPKPLKPDSILVTPAASRMRVPAGRPITVTRARGLLAVQPHLACTGSSAEPFRLRLRSSRQRHHATTRINSAPCTVTITSDSVTGISATSLPPVSLNSCAG